MPTISYFPNFLYKCVNFSLIECIFFQVKELNHYLEAEKSCRTDLEMYVAVLNTQKSVLQEDAEKLRKELHEGKYIFSIYIFILVSKGTMILNKTVTNLKILFQYINDLI